MAKRKREEASSIEEGGKGDTKSYFSYFSYFYSFIKLINSGEDVDEDIDGTLQNVNSENIAEDDTLRNSSQVIVINDSDTATADSDDVCFLGETGNDTFFNIKNIAKSTSLAQKSRAISIDPSKSTHIDLVHVADSALKKRNHRLSTVTKKHKAKKQTAMDNMKEKYLQNHLEASKRGYSGDAKSFKGITEYLEKVRAYEIMELENLPKELVDRAIPTTISSSESTHAATTISSSKDEGAAVWLQVLREKISAALAAPRTHLDIPTSVDTKLYDGLMQSNKNLREEISKIKIDPVAPLKPAPPTEEVLFPELSKEILNSFEEMTRGPDQEELVKAFAIPVCRKDMKTLSGSNWINDEIINFYGELCMKRANEIPQKYAKIHFFNSFFYEKLNCTGYTSVRRWTKKFDIFDLDYIITPIHMTMHWCCAVINFKKKRFEYYDSLHGQNKKCLSLLRDYLEKESLDKKMVPFDTSAWTDYTPNTCPNQENGFDCGVFTCMFIEYSAREMEFHFRQKHMPYLRKRIAWEIKQIKLLWWEQQPDRRS